MLLFHKFLLQTGVLKDRYNGNCRSQCTSIILDDVGTPKMDHVKENVTSDVRYVIRPCILIKNSFQIINTLPQNV